MYEYWFDCWHVMFVIKYVGNEVKFVASQLVISLDKLSISSRNMFFLFVDAAKAVELNALEPGVTVVMIEVWLTGVEVVVIGAGGIEGWLAVAPCWCWVWIWAIERLWAALVTGALVAIKSSNDDEDEDVDVSCDELKFGWLLNFNWIIRPPGWDANKHFVSVLLIKSWQILNEWIFKIGKKIERHKKYKHCMLE